MSMKLYEMSMKLNEISVELLLPYNDYLNDSNFLSLFFELFTGYEAIMVIICRRKIRAVNVVLSSYDEILNFLKTFFKKKFSKKI